MYVPSHLLGGGAMWAWLFKCVRSLQTSHLLNDVEDQDMSTPLAIARSNNKQLQAVSHISSACDTHTIITIACCVHRNCWN